MHGTDSLPSFETRPAAAPQDEAGVAVVRNATRKAKNLAKSDRIRDELLARGVVLKDSKDGTAWEIAR